MAATSRHPKKRVQVIRMKGLHPFWGNPLNDQPGHGRWAVTPVGGPKGYLHMNRDDDAVTTTSCTVGFMHFPAGVSSPGIHVHNAFDEVYVALKGQLAVISEDGSEQILDPLDCAFVPAGVPHGARNVGVTECQLLYFQTGVEREGFQTGKDTDLGSSRWLGKK